MKTFFLSSPIGQEGSEVRKISDLLWEYVIQPVCKKLNYQPVRADKITNAGSITHQVIQHLTESDIVVFDVSDQNPNVMYELGIRHSIGKPAVLLIRDGARIPFDVKD